MFYMFKKTFLKQTANLGADPVPGEQTMGDHAADIGKTALGTAIGLGAVTIAEHVMSDGASGLLNGVSAGGAFTASF